MSVHISKPADRCETLTRVDSGYHEAVLSDVPPGARYTFVLADGTERPDPASRFQPDGVHAASQVVSGREFKWTDAAWRGLDLPRFVLYEIHVGTFTPEGTFDAAITRLDDLVELGVTSIEIMPVAQCPGRRNWGYDGAYLYAVQASYGGPEGLRRFIDACHHRGLAVTLDVVYNHLGPEGNYLGDFGPYFTDRYPSPWGRHLNFDGRQCRPVRRFFIENALYWMREFHVDAFRLDAVQGIIDHSDRPFLAELAAEIHAEAERLGRQVHVIAESDMNEPKIVAGEADGGWGHDSQWCDDLHHALHAALTGERDGYYHDYGPVGHVRTALEKGFVLSGQYSEYRKQEFGGSADGLAGVQFVVYGQNHDQAGNRPRGDRLSTLVPFDALKLVAGAVILSPFLPLLFMGEEYAETAPFLYFIDHSDPGLIDAVRRGRKRDFASFNWKGEVPDPKAESTFAASKLDHALATTGHHAVLRRFYRELLRLRREMAAFARLDRDAARFGSVGGQAFWMRRGDAAAEDALVLFNFADIPTAFPHPGDGRWTCLLDSADAVWSGPGTETASVFDESTDTIDVSPLAVVVYRQESGIE